MLRGANELNLDAKGRLAIPSRYRNGLIGRCEGRLMVTVAGHQERCLWMYPLDAWTPVEQKVLALPDFNRVHQRLKRYFVGEGKEVEMDKNGRVLLPAELRKFASITKQICLLGQGHRFELWDQKLWSAERAKWMKEAVEADALSPEMQQLTL